MFCFPIQRASILVVVVAMSLSAAALLDPATAAAEGIIETIAGTGIGSDGGEGGPALTTNLGRPFGAQIGPQNGALYLVEYGTHRVRMLDLADDKLANTAGTGKAGYSGDDGPAGKAALNEPHEIAFDRAGNLYITDMKNHAIRKVKPQAATISTFAGTGKSGFSGDGGPADKAQLSGPHSVCVAVDPASGGETLYIADVANHRIRKVDLASGIISTVSGTGEAKMPTDGARASESPLRGPRAVCVGNGSLWIALREGNSVWRIDLAKGTLHHVAGTGQSGFAVEQGAAKDAQFASPKGVAFGPDNCLYVADSSNHVIRRIDPSSGKISLVAGQPKAPGFSGDGGPAEKSQLNNPHGILATPDGTLYIGDSDNHRFRRIRPAK